MKKLVSLTLALVMIVAVFATMGLGVTAASNVQYSDHMQGAKSYDITNSSIAWVKQSTGALIWVYADDARSESEIIAQAKNADPSLANACDAFAVLKGEGVKYTPNKKGSQAKVTVAVSGEKLMLNIDGNYSHFVKGDGGKTEPKPEPKPQPTPGEETGEKVNMRIDTAKKMAVKFEDGEIYYNGDMKEVVVGKEYAFQMATVNWENGIFDGEENGLCGTVVYRMKVVHEDEFKKLREEALKNPERYTVKGIDIIDNEAKTIVINCDAENFHLETDVNNFFMAYRFHFKQDYNKQTGIDYVVKPTESLSVNLPLGTVVCAKAYNNFEYVQHAYILVCNNSGEGVYESEYLTSVNDYYWDTPNHYQSY